MGASSIWPVLKWARIEPNNPMDKVRNDRSPGVGRKKEAREGKKDERIKKKGQQKGRSPRARMPGE